MRTHRQESSNDRLLPEAANPSPLFLARPLIESYFERLMVFLLGYSILMVLQEFLAWMGK
jgi:hypothetical protein